MNENIQATLQISASEVLFALCKQVASIIAITLDLASILLVKDNGKPIY
jgi:hypothetical protein